MMLIQVCSVPTTDVVGIGTMDVHSPTSMVCTSVEPITSLVLIGEVQDQMHLSILLNMWR